MIIIKSPEKRLCMQFVALYFYVSCLQRARLVLAAKKVPYDRVNVDLNNKPDWFFDINFYGEVPVIIHNGKNIFESLICAGQYLAQYKMLNNKQQCAVVHTNHYLYSHSINVNIFNNKQQDANKTVL